MEYNSFAFANVNVMCSDKITLLTELKEEVH